MAEKYYPPKGAVNAAKKALKWKKEYPNEIVGGTRVGWTRASQLASGKGVSEDIVRRMAKFVRHRSNSEIHPDKKGKPWTDAGYVAWLIWGGDTGISWAQRTAKQIDRKKQKNESYDKLVNEIILEEIQNRLQEISEEIASLEETKNGLENACWDDYEAVGFKMKNGKRVPNCVPKKK